MSGFCDLHTHSVFSDGTAPHLLALDVPRDAFPRRIRISYEWLSALRQK